MNIKYFIVYLLSGSRHFVAGPDFEAAMLASGKLYMKDVSDYFEIDPAQFPQLDFARLETLSEEARQQWLERISSTVQGGLNAKRDEPADEPIFEREPHATGAEQCTVRVTAMESIPAGANPFLYDSWPMGIQLPNGWLVMLTTGLDSKDDPHALTWLYLVNTRSGQRIKLNFDYEGFKPESDIMEDLVDAGISREMLEAVGELPFGDILPDETEDMGDGTIQSWYSKDKARLIFKAGIAHGILQKQVAGFLGQLKAIENMPVEELVSDKGLWPRGANKPEQPLAAKIDQLLIACEASNRTVMVTDDAPKGFCRGTAYPVYSFADDDQHITVRDPNDGYNPLAFGDDSNVAHTHQLKYEHILAVAGKLVNPLTPEAAPTTPYPEPKLIQANWNVDPSELNPNKRAVDVSQSLKNYEWFEYTGNPRDVIHKSGPSLEVKHGTVFGVRVDVKDGLGREELVFPALGTALSFNVSKNRIKHWKDRAIPLPDTQFVKDKRCLGFWNNERGQYPQFPMPKPTDMRPSLRKAIVDALADVQASPLLQVVNYRGYSSCRICGNQQVNRELDYQMGSKEYSIAPEYGKAHGWMWPEGLSHYIHEHGVVLPEAFLIEVLGIGRNRLAALGYYDLIELAPGVRVVQDGQIKTGFRDVDARMPQEGELVVIAAHGTHVTTVELSPKFKAAATQASIAGHGLGTKAWWEAVRVGLGMSVEDFDKQLTVYPQLVPAANRFASSSSEKVHLDLGTANKYAVSDNGDQS